MLKVKILTNSNHLLERQIGNVDNIVGNCKFYIGNEIKDEDYVVVLDDIDCPINCSLDCAHRLLFTCEPPYVKVYPQKYLRQFGHIYTCQNHLIKKNVAEMSIPALPWMLGYNLKDKTHEYKYTSEVLDYNYFKNHNTNNRLEKICLITSNKKITRGHSRRVNFALRLKKDLPSLIDIFGNGFEHIDDKYDILSRYKYSIVIENCSYPNYWTEKLGDCYLAGCYPIYYGASNIFNYFNNNQLTKIDIMNYSESKNQIISIIENKTYDKCLSNIMDAKEKILNQYNLFNLISQKIMFLESNSENVKISCKDEHILNPINFSLLDKIKMHYLRSL